VTAYDDQARAFESDVRSALAHALGTRGLLLDSDAAAAAMAANRQTGRRLLGELLKHCYGVSPEHGASVRFGDDADATRVELAVAFGAVTGQLLAPPDRARDPQIQLLCGAFNLGIGLIDGLCDRDAPIGLSLLEAVAGADVRGGTRRGWPAGRLVSRLPVGLLADSAALFVARVIEAVLELLQSVHPGVAGQRTRDEVGRLLLDALEAEVRSVAPRQGIAGLRQLRECSRRTSVLPFRIIEWLATEDLGAAGSEPPATADPEAAAMTPGVVLGEAMWRLDDLVDLVADLERGALNGILLDVPTANGPDPDRSAVLSELHDSGVVTMVAARAAELLAQSHGGPGAVESWPGFLAFVQTYAGLDSVAGPAEGP
jgi:hypothetical protein